METKYASEDDDSMKVSVFIVSIHCNKQTKLIKLVKKPFCTTL